MLCLSCGEVCDKKWAAHLLSLAHAPFSIVKRYVLACLPEQAVQHKLHHDVRKLQEKHVLGTNILVLDCTIHAMFNAGSLPDGRRTSDPSSS